MSSAIKEKEKQKKDQQVSSELTCGIVMPIANHPEYKSGHWNEILTIIKECISEIEEYNFKCALVSESNGIIDPIHKHIVTNLFESDIVICDISSKNPNVFFELGMRLAFDKPIIIIKDQKTDSPFDTSIIRYIEYDTELRYSNIIQFKSELSKSILATVKEKINNPNFSPFLKYFKEINYDAKSLMNTEEINAPSYVQLILNKLEFLERNQRKITNSINHSPNNTVKSKAFQLEETAVDGLLEMYHKGIITKKEVESASIGDIAEKLVFYLDSNEMYDFKGNINLRVIMAAFKRVKDIIFNLEG